MIYHVNKNQMPDKYKDLILEIILKKINKADCIVFLFGSYASGDSIRGSDVDIGILCKNLISAKDFLEIEEELNNNLPRKKLPRTFEKFEASVAKLKEALKAKFESQYNKEVLVEIVTKRFEYTFESLWKILKEILFEEGLECNSPLSTFKEAFKLGIISEKNEEIFSLMVKKRNEIVHVYSEEDAYEIYVLIKNTFATAIFEVFEAIRTRKL